MRSFSADLAHPTGLQGGSTFENIALSFVFSPFILFISAIALPAVSRPDFGYRQLGRGKGCFQSVCARKGSIGERMMVALIARVYSTVSPSELSVRI